MYRIVSDRKVSIYKVFVVIERKLTLAASISGAVYAVDPQ